jgi:hypothetical protein
LTYNWQHLHDYIVTTSCSGGERRWHITDSIFMTIPWLLVAMGEKGFDIYDIVMKMLSVMSKHISSITTSSHGIVMKMLSVICQSLSPPLQLVVTVLSWKCTPVMCRHLEKWIGSLSCAMHPSATINKKKILSVPHTSRSKYCIMQVDNCPLLHYLNAFNARD